MSVLTEDEIVNTLSHSSLPTVVVEGIDDRAVYEWIEDLLGPLSASVLPCGGRSILLNVFRRRAEFAGTPTVFLADQDMWLFTAIPAEFQDIIWTAGYSIENDLYAGAPLEKLLTAEERKNFSKLRSAVIDWFGFEVEEYRAGRDSEVSTHINRIVPPGTFTISNSFAKARGYQVAPKATLDDLTKNYALKLRGKTLMETVIRFLSANKHRPKHSRAGLLEMAAKCQDQHVFRDRLLTDIRAGLGIA